MRKLQYLVVAVCCSISLLGCGKQVAYTSQAEFDKNKSASSIAMEAERLHDEGLGLYNEKLYEEAIEVWLRELEITYNKSRAYNNIGELFRVYGNYSMSVAFYDSAINSTDDQYLKIKRSISRNNLKVI